MTCKLNHADPEVIPDFLCRACHPELNLTDEQRAQADNAERQERQAWHAHQELLRTRAKLAKTERAAERGGNMGIEARKAKALRAKVAKLEGCDHTATPLQEMELQPCGEARDNLSEV